MIYYIQLAKGMPFALRDVQLSQPVGTRHALSLNDKQLLYTIFSYVYSSFTIIPLDFSN